MAVPLLPLLSPAAYAALGQTVRWGFISLAVYLAGDSLESISDDVKETITPTTDLPDGRNDSLSFTMVLGIVGTIISVGYLFDKIGAPILGFKRKK